VLLGGMLHAIPARIAGAAVVMVMCQDVSDDLLVVGHIQAVAGLPDVVKQACNRAIARVCMGGCLGEVESSRVLGISLAGAISASTAASLRGFAEVLERCVR
jgi:hypothetical protein